MNIRQKLTLQFLVIVSVIFTSASVSIYLFSVDYRRDAFYERLISKATNTAKLLIDVDEVDIDLLRKIEKDNPTSLPRERITVYDSANHVLFTTDENNRLAAGASFLDSVRLQKQIRYMKDSFEVVGFVFQGKAKKNVVIAGAVDLFGKRRLEYLSNTIYYVAIASFILVLVSGWFFAGQALYPIKAIVDRVDEITINKLNLRVDEGKGKDELSRLAKTFNQMLEGLEEGFTVQKNFIANASHELRTPLTAITGQLEVDLMQERTSEEYKKTIESVLADMKDLNAVSNRLLLLTQTTLQNSELPLAPLRIDDVLWKIKAETERHNPEYHIHIDFKEDMIDDKMLIISGNEQLLKTAFSNLVENSCKYSPDHTVFIALSAEGKKLAMKFSDNGIGIIKEDIVHLFEPFYRGKNALRYKGHGIGLSLVKKIVDLHRGKIEVVSVVGSGTVFTLWLPLHKK